MKFNLLLLLMMATSFVFGQGTIRGYVKDKSNGEPVIFTTVKIKGTSLGSTTDVEGFFQITKIPAGKQTVEIITGEFKPFEEEIEIASGDLKTVKFYLEENSEMLDAFEVNAEAQEAKSKVKISVVKATKKEISAVVSVGGEADIATYFETVPGVVSTGDQGGQMYVRGGSPVQNKVLLDGMVIYNPFHSIGFFSVFDTDVIRNADIYTGGFSSYYGGRISSIMDITTKGGNKKELDGRVAVNPFGAKMMVNGPLKKLDESGEGSSISYILSGKTSYLQQTSKVLYPYADTAGLPFNYTDVYGKISIDGGEGSKANFFGFSFNDRVNWQAVSDLHWKSGGGGSNFVLVPAGSKMIINGNLNYSDYQISLSEQDPITGDPLPARSSRINGFNGGFNFKYVNNEDEIRYGFEIVGMNTEFEFFNSVGREIQQNSSTNEIALYLDYKIVRNRLVLNPGFRAHYYASNRFFSPEPRLGAKFNVNEKFRLKMASGIFSQNIMSANSDRDVVNLFYGFLTGPTNLQDDIILENGTVKERTHSLQKAVHLIKGFEYDLGKRLTLNVEGYFKWFTQLTNMNRNKVYDDTPANNDIADIAKKDFIVETGTAKGVDMVLKYNTDRAYVWFVYSLGKVDRWDGAQAYSPVFDRRHNINFVGTYFLDKGRNWEINARWNLGSGLPFTQTQGYYHNIDFSQGIGTDLGASNSGDLGVIYADLNGGRLPAYHRLDLSLKRHIELENSTIDVTASVTNAYNRNNIFYVNRVTNETVHQLPVLPSLGLSWSF